MPSSSSSGDDSQKETPCGSTLSLQSPLSSRDGTNSDKDNGVISPAFVNQGYVTHDVEPHPRYVSNLLIGSQGHATSAPVSKPEAPTTIYDNVNNAQMTTPSTNAGKVTNLSTDNSNGQAPTNVQIVNPAFEAVYSTPKHVTNMAIGKVTEPTADYDNSPQAQQPKFMSNISVRNKPDIDYDNSYVVRL